MGYIDLTGSQYGIHKPVHEVNTYNEKYVKQVTFITPKGTFKTQLLCMGGNTSLRKMGNSISWRHEQGIADVIKCVLQTHIETFKMTKSQFLLRSVNDYHVLEADVLRSLAQYVAETSQDRFAQYAKLLAMADTFNKDEEEKEKSSIYANNEREMAERWPTSAFPQSCEGL
jgi:hypothetical protein